MADPDEKKNNTGYSMFYESCWSQHKRLNSQDKLEEEVAQFHRTCSVWWMRLKEDERKQFEEMAESSKSTSTSEQNLSVPKSLETRGNKKYAVSGNHSTSKNSSASSFSSNDVVFGSITIAPEDNEPGTSLGLKQKRSISSSSKPKQKQDPNAPKKPLSTYFSFCSEERPKIKIEFPHYSMTEMSKELGHLWKTIDPDIKERFEKIYQEAKKVYDYEMIAFKGTKNKDVPLKSRTAYFIFYDEQSPKLKEKNPHYTLLDLAKEVGQLWLDLDESIKDVFRAKERKEKIKKTKNKEDSMDSLTKDIFQREALNDFEGVDAKEDESMILLENTI